MKRHEISTITDKLKTMLSNELLFLDHPSDDLPELPRNWAKRDPKLEKRTKKIDIKID